MSYKEEIFSRLELSGFETKADIQKWLAGDNKPLSSYSNFATQLQEPFAVRQQADKIDETDWIVADDLRELKSEAQTLDSELGRTDTINQIQRKLNIVENLEETQIDLREQLIAEREVLKQELAEAETREELKEAERELRELSPQSIGGIKSGRTRRVPKAFATLFD